MKEINTKELKIKLESVFYCILVLFSFITIFFWNNSKDLNQFIRNEKTIFTKPTLQNNIQTEINEKVSTFQNDHTFELNLIPNNDTIIYNININFQSKTYNLILDTSKSLILQ
jgi:flagellar basal body-associated protein FliL